MQLSKGLSLIGISAGMGLWLMGCSKTETPAAATAPLPSAPATATGQKPQKGGGVMDITDNPAPPGIKPGLENGKLYSAKPKGRL